MLPEHETPYHPSSHSHEQLERSLLPCSQFALHSKITETASDMESLETTANYAWSSVMERLLRAREVGWKERTGEGERKDKERKRECES